MFHDREDAGRRLAARCGHLAGDDVIVLGLPRGGVPVAEQVAEALHAPLDVCVVRKLGVPYQPELGMGAIGEGGARVINDDVVQGAQVGAADVAAVEEHERGVLRMRARRYRGSSPPAPLDGRTAVVVDDGIATGSTARAACRIARERGARRVVLAVPVAPVDWRERLAGAADDYVTVETPRGFAAIGQFYDDFTQTSDAEVTACLARSAERDRENGAAGAAGADVPGEPAAAVHRSATAWQGETPLPPEAREEPVVIPATGGRLSGDLTVPATAAGIVLFAHGSGSSRHSPRNRMVAAALNEAGLGTLLFDLLTDDEARDRANVFDTALLAGRLAEATAWLRTRPEADGRTVGYFGASTGAGAALWAAAEPGTDVAAVVSRGGRPDLAGDRLPHVRPPTLLIVGGRDIQVLDLNRQAQLRLRCENRLAVVPGATHLFEEPGTLESVSTLAADWFTRHLSRTPQHT
ncbi:phosphoribosyltransferase family protein [Actinacidiphila acidipaludis]|uniref:phosphoribosyltransferase family protein n=1 Tax=Actinacidiphila acidipaludis TaxID=2873382 RepID=UPI0027DF7646|nr:phosphoribosyltransferase family protein [Streptomyces acidipaludis]